MPPKPFPFPIGVGTDICHTTRFLRFIRDDEVMNQFARKVFTRLEWPYLYRKFLEVGYDLANEDERSWGDERPIETLPSLSRFFPPRSDPKKALPAPNLQIGNLARYLAGRWAAKEAAIKAHRHRRLHYRDVSIIPRLESDQDPSMSSKAYVLIEPVARGLVLMTESVALSRGVVAVAELSADLLEQAKGFRGQKAGGESAPDLIRKFRRVRDEDRQLAELSLSHDGDYAVAVCMALDEEVKDSGLEPPIIDDGSGNPIHEPEWGEKGWLRQD